VRVSSNRAVIPAAKSPREAVQALETMVARPHHVFWADDLSIADRQWVAVDKLIGFRQVTDAHLLGLALKRGGQLLTLDRPIAGLVPSAFDRQHALAFIV